MLKSAELPEIESSYASHKAQSRGAKVPPNNLISSMYGVVIPSGSCGPEGPRLPGESPFSYTFWAFFTRWTSRSFFPIFPGLPAGPLTSLNFCTDDVFIGIVNMTQI